MPELRLIGLGNHILRDVHLLVPDGEALAVVGPSGAGKTSLLRAIAGLARHHGKILMDGREIQNQPTNARAIGLVSQDLYLFPHLTLEGNLRLAMKKNKGRENGRQAKAVDLLEMLRVSHLAGRKPGTFSGGEKQRAALARALASAPRLLLMDEPFSKLDFRTAGYLRAEFNKLRQRLGLTTIFVTHDMKEAAQLGDHLAVMRSGRLETVASDPAAPGQGLELAEAFLGGPNIFPCRVTQKLEHGLVQLAWAGGSLLIPDEGRSFFRAAIGRRDIVIGASPPPGPSINRFEGRIRSVEKGDDSVRVAVDVEGLLLRIEISHEQWRHENFPLGARVYGMMKMKDLEAR